MQKTEEPDKLKTITTKRILIAWYCGSNGIKRSAKSKWMEYLVDSNVLIIYVDDRLTIEQLIKFDLIFDSALNMFPITML